LAAEQSFKFFLQIARSAVFICGFERIHSRTVVFSECLNECRWSGRIVESISVPDEGNSVFRNPCAYKSLYHVTLNSQVMGLMKPSGGGGEYAELIFKICATKVGSFGIQFPITIRPPGRVTRTISFATSKGFGANIAPKMLTTMSNDWSLSPCRFDASPSLNLQFVRPSSSARLFPASTRFLAISTPRTSAPSLASGNAVVPSPQPRSRTLSPFVIPSPLTSA